MAAAQDPSPIAGLLAFRGRVPTFSDALVILEACRQGSLTMVNRRLTDLERREIACGDVFVFDEAVSGIKRWADGRLWSSSRMRDCFLIYVELGMAAGISGFNPRRVPASSPSELLRKKVLSITTSTGQRLRLVAYSSAMDDDSDEPAPDSNIQGITPRRDPRLANIVIPAGIFHSNTGPMGGARGDAEQQQQQQQQQQSRVANAAQVSPSGSSASITGRSRGRPSAAIAAAAAAAAVGRSRSAASTVSNAHHQHHHAHGGHNYDSPYYGGIGHCNPSSSGSPPSSTMSAPAPDQHASNGPRRYHDQHLRRSADATSPAGSGCSAWTSTPTSAGSDVARYRAPYTGVGAYADMTTGYLPQHHHAYPPQHSYQHAYHGSAAAHAPPQQHSPAGYYDSAYDRYRPLSAHPPPQRASAAAGDPPVATVPAASTTPASRHSDPLTSLSSSTAGPPAAPVLTPNAYAADTLHHGTCPTYPHPHHYYPRYSGAIVPRFHPHHHHPAAPYYGGPAAPAPPPSSGQSYLPHSAPAPAPDPAAVTNGSTSHAPAPSPPSMGTRTSPPKTDPGMSSARSLDMSERTKDMPRVHRADSGMYLARDHRDRPGAWSGAHMCYPPVGFGFGIAGANGDASASDRMGDAGRQDASPLGRVSDRDETGGRLSPTSVAVAGEAAGRSAGVV